jgi:gamma-glutamylcyclotransferase (GGCT)/AIG2-like uncharacterized protein YtfP
MQTILVFVYGVAMDPVVMREMCPNARFVGTAVLLGWDLQFAGRSASGEGAEANAVPCEGGHVAGVVWAVDEDDLDVLDQRAGVERYRRGGKAHGLGYERVALEVQLEGRWALVMVYVKWQAPVGAPSPTYFDRIASGYEQHSFDATPLQQAVFQAAVRG